MGCGVHSAVCVLNAGDRARDCDTDGCCALCFTTALPKRGVALSPRELAFSGTSPAVMCGTDPPSVPREGRGQARGPGAEPAVQSGSCPRFLGEWLGKPDGDRVL